MVLTRLSSYLDTPCRTHGESSRHEERRLQGRRLGAFVRSRWRDRSGIRGLGQSAGVSRATLYSWFNGDSAPDTGKLTTLAAAWDADPAEMMAVMAGDRSPDGTRGGRVGCPTRGGRGPGGRAVSATSSARRWTASSAVRPRIGGHRAPTSDRMWALRDTSLKVRRSVRRAPRPSHLVESAPRGWSSSFVTRSSIRAMRMTRSAP